MLIYTLSIFGIGFFVGLVILPITDHLLNKTESKKTNKYDGRNGNGYQPIVENNADNILLFPPKSR